MFTIIKLKESLKTGLMLPPITHLTNNLPVSCKGSSTFLQLTLSCAIIQIRTIARGLQKNGQHTFGWVLGSLWWLDQEREQHGRHFVPVWSILVKFSIFYRPQRHANSNNGDGRRRSLGIFRGNGRVFRWVLQRTTRLKIQTVELLSVWCCRGKVLDL